MTNNTQEALLALAPTTLGLVDTLSLVVANPEYSLRDKIGLYIWVLCYLQAGAIKGFILS